MGMAGGHFLISVNYSIYCLLPHPRFLPKCQAKLPSRVCQKPKRGWPCPPVTGTRNTKRSSAICSSPAPQVETPLSRCSGQILGRILGSFFFPTHPHPIHPLCKPSQFCLHNTPEIQPLWSKAPLSPAGTIAVACYSLVPSFLFCSPSICSSEILLKPNKALFSSESSTLPFSATRMATITKMASGKCW